MSIEVFALADTPDLLGTSPADLIDRYAPELPTATVDEARERAERVRAGLDSYTRMRQDIADAYAHQDWKPLGYGGWFKYVEGEFGAELRKLGRDERREAVRDLREQGMSTRQIGAATGVSDMQVRRDLAQVRPDVAPEVSPNGLPQVRSDYAPERPVEPRPVAPAPEKVTGKDGKSYPAKRPSTSDEKPSKTELKPEDRPGYWSPEDRRQHEEEVQLRKDRESARTYAANIVTQVRTYTVTIITGYRLGEHGLVTPEMIADLRKAIDNLEKEVIADAQR